MRADAAAVGTGGRWLRGRVGSVLRNNLDRSLRIFRSRKTCRLGCACRLRCDCGGSRGGALRNRCVFCVRHVNLGASAAQAGAAINRSSLSRESATVDDFRLGSFVGVLRLRRRQCQRRLRHRVLARLRIVGASIALGRVIVDRVLHRVLQGNSNGARGGGRSCGCGDAIGRRPLAVAGLHSAVRIGLGDRCAAGSRDLSQACAIGQGSARAKITARRFFEGTSGAGCLKARGRGDTIDHQPSPIAGLRGRRGHVAGGARRSFDRPVTARSRVGTSPVVARRQRRRRHQRKQRHPQGGFEVLVLLEDGAPRGPIGCPEDACERVLALYGHD